jgi:hypothetical protein
LQHCAAAHPVDCQIASIWCLDDEERRLSFGGPVSPARIVLSSSRAACWC